MRRRRETKRDTCSHLEKHLETSEVKNPWTIGWRRFCEGTLSALRSARAQDDRVVAVAQGASQCSQNARHCVLRRALRGVPSPTSVLGRRSLVEPFGCSVCAHAGAIHAHPRARLAAGV